MSWRGREDRGTRWESDSRWETRARSPQWEPRRSDSRDSPPRRSPDRHRYRDDRRERYERDYRRHDRRDRDRDRERDRDRDRERDRERQRSPKRYDDDAVYGMSPPSISNKSSRSSSRSESRERDRHEEYEKEKYVQDDQSMSASPGDWVCKCGSYNFKRRQVCYRRTCSGKRSDGVIYGGDGDKCALNESSGITKRLLFRRLDALTTEEKILEAVKERCSKSVLDSIAGITIGREALTGASKCLAYINFNSIADSTAAHTELVRLQPPLNIDGRDVLISFYNELKKITKPNNLDYPPYYAQMSSYAASQALSEADRVNAAAAVAQSAISAAQARHLSWTPVPASFVASTTQNNPAIKAPTGDGKTIYTAPDVRTFMYDETSGYYYDPATGLYYDGKTQYFYNSQTSQYMYWDGSTSTYVAVSQSDQRDQNKSQNATEATGAGEKKKRDKEDKVKVAKKIAKDMERWARTLNQKKENARSNIVMEQPLDTGSSKGSADIGFSVLGAGPSITHVRELSPPPPGTDEFLVKKRTEPDVENDEGVIDWTKLTCLLCKRRFPSADVLNKHKTFSELHKQNLAENRNRTELLPQSNGYRDRAAERRLKFGEDEPPIIRKRYEPPEIITPMPAHPPPSVVDTIGGKMLQKMGWSEGRGLGKTEQGRIAPIEAEQRLGLAGLGQKRGIYTPTPGETYRDTVKKLMIARYKEVVGQEEGK